MHIGVKIPLTRRKMVDYRDEDTSFLIYLFEQPLVCHFESYMRHGGNVIAEGNIGNWMRQDIRETKDI
jgi:hypothetical protein